MHVCVIHDKVLAAVVIIKRTVKARVPLVNDFSLNILKLSLYHMVKPKTSIIWKTISRRVKRSAIWGLGGYQ